MRRLAILFLAVACPALASPTPPVLRVESPDVEQVLKNDPQPDGAPPLVAVTSEVAWSSSTHGAWSVSADGAWSWRLVVESPGSLQIALAVGAQGQPEGAELRFGVAGGPGRALETALFNATPRWLPLLPGDSFELSLDLPPGSSPDRSSLLISQVAHGFRGQLSGQNPAKSDACEIDVACAEADPWRDEVRSALRYTYPVPPFWIAICSGQAVRDEPGSFRPWVLTATHCGVTAENQRDLVVYWNDQASSCAGPRDGSHDQSQLGAIVRWEDGLSDTMLLELESSPPAEFGVHYSGWDATDSPVSGVVGIHHPAGDEKSISIASRQLLAGGDCTIDFELRSDTGDEHFVWVSMDAFTDDATKLGIPTLASGAHFQQAVTNVTVVSDVATLATGDGLAGQIELWPGNYGARNASGVEGASDEVWDHGDQPAAEADGYGSMQVHALETRQTLFAVNHWRVGGGRADIGIGSSDLDPRCTDWTFARNGSGYLHKRLRVFVRLR